MSSPVTMAMESSYWCYRCSRLVRVWDLDAIVCPECDGGFLEAVETPPRLPSPPTAAHRRILNANAMYMIRGDTPAAFRPRDSELRFRRSRRTARGDRSPFNPVIVLRGPSDGGGTADPDRTAATGFDLYYDDGAGSGLRPLPASMSDFLMGSGFDRLLDQIAQIDINGGGGGRGCEHPPASKAAVESMPTIEIAARHISMDSHCAVCKDPFELGTEAREMPCKHIYHRDCILPWLALRNSCPVCRCEMPTDVRGRGSAESDGDEPAPLGGTEEDTMGLTIWRLPGGGFAVGRFSGGRRAGEREPPVVYTEMDGGFNTGGERELPVVYTEMDGGGGDGGFNTGGAPRRILSTSRRNRSTESRGIGRVFRNFFSFFGRRRSSSSSRLSSDSAPSSPHSSRSSNPIRRPSLSRSVSGAAPVWH